MARAFADQQAPTQRELMLAKLKRESDAEDMQVGLDQAKMKRELAKKELEAFAANKAELARQEVIAQRGDVERLAEQFSMLSSIAGGGSAGEVTRQILDVDLAKRLAASPTDQLELLKSGKVEKEFKGPGGGGGEDPEAEGAESALREFARRRKLQQLLGEG